MKIGIISDTHDDFKITELACRVFKSRNVDLIIHAGDFTSPGIIKLFRDFKCKFIKGNADIEIDKINDECSNLGFECLEDICDLKIENKRILVMHGNVVPSFREAVDSGKYDYIIKGHTHHFEDYIRNNVRIINPGSLYGPGDHSIVILDTEKDEVEKLNIYL